MGNLKHTIAAVLAVSLVGSLAAAQTAGLTRARANKLTQETTAQETIQTETVSAPEVLAGDGEGETADFSISTPSQQVLVGKDAYILTSGGSINLRAAADTESTILNVLTVGTQVKIIDIDEDWFKIEAGDYIGYVKSEFVSLDYNRVQEIMLQTSMYRKGRIKQSINVRSAAGEDSVILAQAAEGSDIIILEETDGWLKIYFGENYDIGYINAEFAEIGEMVSRKEISRARTDRLSEIMKPAKIKASEGKAEVKTMPDVNSDKITELDDGASCKIISGGTNWTKIVISATNEIGYVRTENVAAIVTEVKKPEPKAEEPKKTEAKPAAKTETKKAAEKEEPKAAPATGNGSALVNQAAKYIGTKYVYGGTSPSGFDCSGLVQYCCRKLGVSVNRSAASQYSNGTAVSRSNLQPGDLVFFSRGGKISHVAIYAGNGQVIHSPRSGKTVCYQSLDSLCKYSSYVGARRVM